MERACLRGRIFFKLRFYVIAGHYRSEEGVPLSAYIRRLRRTLATRGRFRGDESEMS